MASATDTLVFSNDGATFDTTTLPATNNWTRVQIGGLNDDIIMATGDNNSDIYVGSLTTSNDSTIVAGNWTTKALGTGNKNWVGLAYGAGKWIAIATDGTTVISTDSGVSWSAGSAVTPGGAEEYTDLIFGSNAWVASMKNLSLIHI